MDQNPLSKILAPVDPARFDALEQRRVVPDDIPEYGRGKVLNRYWDVLPTPGTRVRLAVLGGDPATEYINANFVRGFDGKAREYIAAQGPVPQTTAAFVRMIWEQGCVAVVNTTRLTEGGKAKCERYWPQSPGTQLVFQDITVQNIKEENHEGFIHATLRLSKGRTSRTVVHYW